MLTNELQVITIRNKNKMELSVINYGATITNLFVPDRNGELVDVIVGLENPLDYYSEAYSKVKLYLGATIGRYAGRISKQGFKIEEKEYKIPHENGVHLHGGNGFDKKFWKIEKVEEDAVIFSYKSLHLEEGYPGNVWVTASFALTEQNKLIIEYKAQTDKPTPINLTSHPYLNLKGNGTVLDQVLHVNSSHYLETDEHLIPTGKIKDSKQTVYDRNKATKIKANNFSGFDDTFIVNEDKIKASLYDHESGIKLEILSNQPALVIYTPKKFPNLPFKSNYAQISYPAICFEAQNFPDAPNNDHFPNAVLWPNETYLNSTVFKFNTK